VIVGSGDRSAIVFAPEPIAKWMSSGPGVAFAASMASRRVQLAALQTPSSVSAFELTVKVAPTATPAPPARIPRTRARRRSMAAV
jgi:hypothetical protein